MKLKLGVVMDPIDRITFKKDSTLAILLEAQRRGFSLYYMEQRDLFLRDGVTYARMRQITVHDNPDGWFTFGRENIGELHQLDVVLMRKDPPFDMEYIYTTYLLERAEAEGLLVINKPHGLRAANEKLFTAWFSQCCPSTLVSCDLALLRDFIRSEGDVVVKPLDGMGGDGVFRVKKGDLNMNSMLETLTHKGVRSIMVQRYIPEIKAGDKRIFIIDGKPFPYALARVPQRGELRGNLAVGGRGVGVELSKRDRWICEQIGPTLSEKGLYIVGLDVIGDYLTEINVTSPTCIRQITAAFGKDASIDIIDCVVKYAK